MNTDVRRDMIAEAKAIQSDVANVVKVLQDEPTTYTEDELGMLCGCILLAAQEMAELLRS